MRESKTITKPIKFYTTMTKDSHEAGAVLRLKWLDYKNRLYPIADINFVLTSNGFKPEKIVQTSKYPSTFILGEDNSNDIAVYEVQPDSSPYPKLVKKDSSGDSDNVADAVFYNNGTDELIYIITKDGDLDTYNPNTDTYTANVQNESGSGKQFICVHPNYDHLYFVTNNKVYRQNGGTYDGNVFDLPSTNTVLAMFPHKDKLIFVHQNQMKEIFVSAWNCDSTNTAFDWTYSIGTWRLFAVGVVHGEIIAVTHRSINANKEFGGEFVIQKYIGGGFRTVNTIETNGEQFVSDSYRNFYTDGNYLYAGVIDNDERFSGIYRFANDGSVIMIAELDNNADYVYDFGFAVTSNGFKLLTSYRDGSNNYVGMLNDRHSDYSDYANESVYITQFFEDGYRDKALKSVYIDFEKMFDGDEEGHIYYRLSDKDNWVEIGEILYGDGKEEDRRHFTRLKDETVLPDFKKIQFKITSKKGLNITGAGYKFIYKDDYE